MLQNNDKVDRPRPRRVLFIHHGGGIGGAPVSMLQLAAALDRRRFLPKAIFTHSGSILDFANRLGIPTRVAPLRSAFFYGAHVPLRLRSLLPFLIYFRSTVRATEQLLREEQPNLVHLNTSVLIPVAIGVKRSGVPLVWHVREVPGSNYVLHRWQTATIARLADRVVATSCFVRDMFPASANVEVVHNALDLNRFRINENEIRSRIRNEFDIPISALVVTMVGSVQVIKGHFLLIEAARQIVQAHPNVRFVIVAGGVGPDYLDSWRGRVKTMLGLPMDNLAAMKHRVAKTGLTDYFIFTGYRQDIPEILAASDIVAFLPQAAEGFGRPLIEAMAAGRPVVATDVGPTREIMGKDTGLLIPCGNVNALALALTELISDRDRRQQIGIAGRKRAACCFSMEHHITKITEIYGTVLSKSHTGNKIPIPNADAYPPSISKTTVPSVPVLKGKATFSNETAKAALAAAWILLVFGSYFYHSLSHILPKLLEILGLGN